MAPARGRSACAVAFSGRRCPFDKTLSSLTRACHPWGLDTGAEMSRRTSAAAARRDLRNELPAIAALCDENVLFYLRLSELAAKIHRQGPLSGPRRTILAGLARSGPRTVAHMARDRGQARQRIQPVVNSLIDDGLLQAAPNTAN